MNRRFALRPAALLCPLLALAAVRVVAVTGQTPSASPATTSQAGVLELRSDPSGATVLLGDHLLGTTPLRVEVSPGTYQVTLRKEGLADQSFPVKVVAGQLVRETRSLNAKPATGGPEVTVRAGLFEPPSLVVFSDPPGATVYLDDEPIGQTDPTSGRLVKSGVAPGPHRVRLTDDGHTEVAQWVTVAAAGPTEVRVSLLPEPAGFSPFLTALLVTGVVGLGILVWRRLKERKAGAGTSPDVPATTDRPPPDRPCDRAGLLRGRRARNRGARPRHPERHGFRFRRFRRSRPSRAVRASGSAITPCASSSARAAWPRCSWPSAATRSWP